MDNKKRRTDDGPRKQNGPNENTELCMGSDEENTDEMEHEPKDPKNMTMAGSGTGVRQGL